MDLIPCAGPNEEGGFGRPFLSSGGTRWPGPSFGRKRAQPCPPALARWFYPACGPLPRGVFLFFLRSHSSANRPPMPDDEKLSPADPGDIAGSIAFALQFSGRKRVHDSDTYMAAIVANRIVRHLERRIRCDEEAACPGRRVTIRAAQGLPDSRAGHEARSAAPGSPFLAHAEQLPLGPFPRHTTQLSGCLRES